MRYYEGVSHGFAVLRSMEGEILAEGDMIQVVKWQQVTSEVVFHFRDGSLYDEVTIYSQKRVFRLISDHLIQKGPSFPNPIDILMDAAKNEVTIHAIDKGKQKDETQHIDLPEDLSNGMVLTLLHDISPSTHQTTVSMLSASAKPRLVKLKITPSGQRAFRVDVSRRKAIDFDIHVEIGGVAGAVAPIVGKQPPDTHVWMSPGSVPTFIRFEGPLYTDGPIWRADLATLRLSDHDLSSNNQKQ